MGLKAIKDKLLKSNSLVFTFLRSMVSSQAASWVDLATGFVLFSLMGLPAWLATALGAICGGAINCLINYRFTFSDNDSPWRAVVVKYVMIWVGSLILNSVGTSVLTAFIRDNEWLQNLGVKKDGAYAAARLITSLLVSWFWNFQLQRRFVYRARPFDATAIKIYNTVTFNRRKVDTTDAEQSAESREIDQIYADEAGDGQSDSKS